MLDESLKNLQDTYHLAPLSEQQKAINREGIALCQAVVGAKPGHWQKVIDSWSWMEA